MSPFWGNAIGVITVLLMLTFIGIWIWLWRKRHKKVFDRMSRLPMEDEIGSQPTHHNRENNRDE